VWADPRFHELVGELPHRAFTRDEGWRYDLAYLVSETKRVHYLYRNQPLPKEFTDEVQALNEQIPTLSDSVIRIHLEHLVSLLGDGHSLVLPVQLRPTEPERGVSEQIQVRFYLFTDGLYIIDAPEEQKTLIGKRVVKFDNTETAVAIQRVEFVQSRDNPMNLKWSLPFYLSCTGVLQGLGITSDPTRVTLTVEDSDKHRAQVLLMASPQVSRDRKLIPSRMPGSPPPPLYLTKVADNYWFEQLPNHSAIYFQSNLFVDKPDESMEEFARRLQTYLDKHSVHNLIVDVRNNNGGNGDRLIPILTTLIHFEHTRPGSRLFVITGRNTFSASQVFIGSLERLTHAVFVGEPSSSTLAFVGEGPYFFKLPFSGVPAAISSRYHQIYDHIDQRMWIAPTVPVTLSSKTYFSNQDPALESIFRIIAHE
jgi:hypothetical protein